MGWWNGKTKNEPVTKIAVPTIADAMLDARIHEMSLTGMAAMRRINNERVNLPGLSDSALMQRFAATPAARMDNPPADMPRRRAWVHEMLIGEAAAIAGGAMSPGKVRRAAMHAQFDAPSPTSTTQFASWSETTDPTTVFATRAHNASEQSDANLLRRFGVLPGAGALPVANPARTNWIHRALEVETVRPMAHLPGPKTPSSTPLIRLDNAAIDASTGLMAQADLLFEQERLCRVAVDSEGRIEAWDWSDGASTADLGILDLYVAATGNPREDGQSPDTLAAVIMDGFAMLAAIAAYRVATADTVLFQVEENAVPTLLQIRIPAGGDRNGARTAMAAQIPQAVCLDDMTQYEAATVWMALAP